MAYYYIHDLDNNLQRFRPEIASSFNRAAVRAAVDDCDLNLPENEVEALIIEGHEKHHDFTVLLIERHGIDWETMHVGYNRRVDRNIVEPALALPGLLQNMGDEAQHCLLTHSHFDWASDCVAIHKIEPWFPENRILSLEMYKGHPKHKGTKGFEMALDRLGGPDPKDTFFSDDTLPNLVTAKKMGLITVWTSHGRPLPKEYVPYVDHMVGSIDIFLQQQAAIIRKNALKP